MLKGSFVALVTPMHRDGALDLDAFAKFVDWQISQGTQGIVPVGTTGESPTLSHAEHCRDGEAGAGLEQREAGVIQQILRARETEGDLGGRRQQPRRHVHQPHCRFPRNEDDDQDEKGRSYPIQVTAPR